MPAELQQIVDGAWDNRDSIGPETKRSTISPFLPWQRS